MLYVQIFKMMCGITKDYRFVMKQFSRLGPFLLQELSTMEKIVKYLFSKHPPREPQTYAVEENISSFTADELLSALSSMLSNEALSSNGNSIAVLKVIANKHLDFSLNAFNACVTSGVFSHH